MKKMPDARSCVNDHKKTINVGVLSWWLVACAVLIWGLLSNHCIVYIYIYFDILFLSELGN